MIDSILFLLALLFIKHWYVDFVDQTNEEVASKGIYGDGPGLGHSIKHGIGTFFAILAVTGYPYIAFAALLMFFDFVTHYHIDWLKVNINRVYGWTSKQMAYWVLFGADQYLHMLTYLLLVYLFV